MTNPCHWTYDEAIDFLRDNQFIIDEDSLFIEKEPHKAMSFEEREAVNYLKANYMFTSYIL